MLSLCDGLAEDGFYQSSNKRRLSLSKTRCLVGVALSEPASDGDTPPNVSVFSGLTWGASRINEETKLK